jgi:hypothetical protein
MDPTRIIQHGGKEYQVFEYREVEYVLLCEDPEEGYCIGFDFREDRLEELGYLRADWSDPIPRGCCYYRGMDEIHDAAREMIVDSLLSH